MNRVLFYTFLISLVACNSTEAPQSETKYRIAYNVWEDQESDNYEVYSMNPDGSDKRNITNLPGVEWVYYAHKDKLFVISDKDTCHRCYFLYEMDAYGENMRKISQYRLRDSWMGSRKDGSELIINPHRSIDSVFHIIDLQGNLVQKLDPGLPYASDPFFSPDGQQVVFRGAKAKFKKDSGYLDELFMINTDGSGLRQLTQYPQNDTTAKWHNYHAGPPFWDPHSNRISYISKQNHTYSIFTIKPDGTDIRQLSEDGFNQGWHAWSPDGKMIAYNGADTTETPSYDIYLMNSDGTNIQQLTQDSTYDQAPVFVEIE